MGVRVLLRVALMLGQILATEFPGLGEVLTADDGLPAQILATQETEVAPSLEKLLVVLRGGRIEGRKTLTFQRLENGVDCLFHAWHDNGVGAGLE